MSEIQFNSVTVPLIVGSDQIPLNKAPVTLLALLDASWGYSS